MMKYFFLPIMALLVFGCNQEPEKPKDYVTFSGKITDKNSDSIQIRNRDFRKVIKVNSDGTFKDTLKVEAGLYSFYDGGESTTLFLKNGYDLNLTLDTKMFDETIVYTGEGAENNNFLAKHSLLQEELLADLDTMEENDLDATFETINARLNNYYDSGKSIDTMVTNSLRKDITPMLQSYKGYYAEKFALKRELPAGSPSPSFKYENYKGGKTSLADLKGKYVYVDVWATWCGPCKKEIPSLKKVEEQYHGKNIEFVSISIDQKKDYETWKQMVADKELGGIQLFADNDWNSDFVKNYKINGIPRFILIDPAGDIVTPDAPRPSDEKLIDMFKELNI